MTVPYTPRITIDEAAARANKAAEHMASTLMGGPTHALRVLGRQISDQEGSLRGALVAKFVGIIGKETVITPPLKER